MAVALVGVIAAPHAADRRWTTNIDSDRLAATLGPVSQPDPESWLDSLAGAIVSCPGPDSQSKGVLHPRPGYAIVGFSHEGSQGAHVQGLVGSGHGALRRGLDRRGAGGRSLRDSGGR